MDRPPPATPEELLAELVAHPTVNPRLGGPAGGAARLGARIEELAAAWGLASRRLPVPGGDEFNLLVSCETAPGAEWLLLESHFDTVDVAGMTVPPHTLTTRGDRLHGRGACDTKGSGAAMLWALRAYARADHRPRNAGVLFVVDEEIGMTGARAFAARELSAFLPRLRGIIVGEPTGLRPVIAHNGVVRWRTVTRGIPAHSADPSRGRSAITAMLRVVAALEEKFIPLARAVDPLTGRAAASINTIRGGTAVNIIPAQCEITCDRRTVPGEATPTILAQRDAALAGLEVTHDDLYEAPPLPAGSGERLGAWLAPVLRGAGLDPTPAGAPYATDAGHYAAAGAPVVVLGPGDIAQAHTPDEWLARSALHQAVHVYQAALAAPATP